MVVGGYDVEFEFAVGRGLEDPGVDFYLFDGGAEEGTEGGCYAGFLAGTRGAVDKEVGEVAAVCLGED